MRLCLFLSMLLIPSAWSATFGTVTPIVGGVVDMVLDSPRQRLYLIGVPDKIEIYSLAQRRFLTPIKIDALPLSLALSLDGKTLYAACHNASAIDLIDTEQLALTGKINLPARPEGIATGGDGRVLITTIGSGVNNALNTLLLFDPALQSLTPLSLPAPAPATPGTAVGPLVQANRSFLSAAADGRFIVGVNIPNATTRSVFVYEVSSATVLRSRTVNNLSSVLSVAPDGTKFMAGLTLFETDTLTILGQQNLANAPYPIAANINFNTQQNQGGSVFFPDGKTLYSAFNIAPTQNPPARANVSQLQVSDADNLLISMGIQMPENLSGKMTIAPDASNIYAVSESGFVTIPIGQLSRSPLAVPERTAVVLQNDQCGVTANERRAAVTIRNEGAGRLTATAQILTATTGAAGVGGVTGPGGVITIVVPGTGGATGGGTGVVIGVPVGQTGTPPTNQAVVGASPTVQNSATADGPQVAFTYNNTNRSLGSSAPTNFLIQSSEAVNIPAQVKVYQNNRDAEARGEIIPLSVGISDGEGLVDIAYDAARRRVYLANSGLNRVDVFDERTKTMLAPIKTGQLPRSMALSQDGSSLYIANSSSEFISIVNLDTGIVSGRLNFPPAPLNTNVALVYPSVIATTQRGLLVMMSNGTLWTSVGNQLVPRATWNLLPTGVITAPRSMAATPAGEYVILVNGAGVAYLYDALNDDIVQSRQVLTGTQLNGYLGPVTAGPRGAYYVVNGITLNQALTPVNSTGSLVAAVMSTGNNQFARFTVPVRANATAVVTDLPAVEVVNSDSGQVLRRMTVLEGPLAAVIGTTGRAAIAGRTMVLDASATNAYVITSSGLSIVNLEPVSTVDRPVISQGGAVSLGSYLADVPAGGIASLFGRNLGNTAAASAAPLPTVIGGVCVTMSNATTSTALPLFATTPGQINVQIPVGQAAGTYQLIVRDTNKKLASAAQTIRIVRYAPAILVDPNTKQAAIFDGQGRAVNASNPTTRDRRLVIYALGLGPTQGGRVTTGAPSPASPLAENVDDVKVFFGDKRYKEAEMIVEWSGLVPGFVGLYQIDIYVPGDRIRGNNLDVTVRVGGVENKQIDALKPTVAVE